MLASEIIGATLPGIALIDGKRGLSLCLDCELEFFDVALLVAVERVLRNDASTMDSPGLLALPAASAIDASTGIYKRSGSYTTLPTGRAVTVTAIYT